MKFLSCRLPLIFCIAFLVCSTALAQKGKGKRKLEPPVDDGRPPQATPVDQIKAMKDFRVELLYSVPRDVVDPSKVISDHYQAVVIRTADGRVVTGRIINLKGDNMTVNIDMLNPGQGGSVSVRRSAVDEMQPSKTSMMPNGLLDTMNDNEVLDLLAFLLSRGDRESPMFAK